MRYEKKYGVNYVVHDDRIEANIDIYGGPSATSIVLHRLQAINPSSNTDFNTLVTYLAEQVSADLKWDTIAVLQGDVVLYSTDPELRKGDRISGRLTAISRAQTLKFGFRPLLTSIRNMFGRQ